MDSADWEARLARLADDSSAADDDTFFEQLEGDPAAQQALETQLRSPALHNTRAALRCIHRDGCEKYMTVVSATLANPAVARSDPAHQKGILKMFRHKWTKVAAAAAIILLVANVWLSWNERSNPNAAFAAAIDHLRGAETIVCRFTTSHTGTLPLPDTTGKLYLSAEHGGRYDMDVGGLTVMTQYMPLDGPVYTVTPATKTYMRIELPENIRDNPTESSPQAWIDQLRQFSADPDRSLGYETIGERSVEHFEVSGERLGLGDDVAAQLWIDTQTQLPVRYEIELANPAEAGTTMLVTHDQFEWDVPLERSLFEVDIPEGYTRIDLAVPPINEQALLDGLATFAEMSGDAYPAELTFPEMMSSMGELSARYAREHGFDKSDTLDAQSQKLMQKALQVGAALQFYMQLQQQGRDPQYFGDQVQPGDADQVLMSWTLDDGQTRVIYGDLTAETAPASD